MEDKGELIASIRQTKDGEFIAMYKEMYESFDTFEEANQWLIDREEFDSHIPEPAASEITEDEAQEFNSQVNHPPKYPGSTGDIHAEE